ncbi:hypothetical protein CANMA_000332 [Candida margitis]|uniref:uncharacterized protein n=1 Tax=Candida margitis TaxID=1775924 RepID=UPI0022264591|nr:uncharacterized protein CANMA_000332 [Candida margitis]KAI5970615.1 hypothetical protein CANMA_000332 [Candida margitis]
MPYNSNRFGSPINISKHSTKAIQPELEMLQKNPSSITLDRKAATHYRSIVGKVLYLSNTIRPDISYTVSQLSKHLKQPTINDLAAAKHLIRYIAGTTHHGIIYSKTKKNVIEGYCDSSWTDDYETSTSTGAYIFKYANGAITWKSKIQSNVSLSTAESEYYSAGSAAKELIWLDELFNELGIPLKEKILYCDNQSTICMSERHGFHNRTKHIRRQWHFIRSHVGKTFKMVYLPTDKMKADFLTKGLAPLSHQNMLTLNNIIDMRKSNG